MKKKLLGTQYSCQQQEEEESAGSQGMGAGDVDEGTHSRSPLLGRRLRLLLGREFDDAQPLPGGQVRGR